MIIELKLIIHYKSLTCNAPQMPRFCRPKITLSCIRFRSFFAFIRFWWSSILLPRFAMHYSNKIAQGSVNLIYLIILKPIAKVHLAFNLLNFQVQASFPTCSWNIMIYINHRSGHKRLQFLVFNRVYLQMRFKSLQISNHAQHLTSRTTR